MIGIFQYYFIKIMRIALDCGRISHKQYLLLLNIYKYKGILTCEICKEPINNNNDNTKMSIDHIVPKSEGGNGNIENLRIAHRKCNCERPIKIKTKRCRDCPYLKEQK